MAIDPITAIKIGTTIFGFLSQRKAAKQSQQSNQVNAQLQYSANYANAQDALMVGRASAGAVAAAGANNAKMAIYLGYENGSAINEATLHNQELLQIDRDRQWKTHEREEKWHAGSLRAMMGGSGVSTNVGSPMAFLQAEIKAGIEERQFNQDRNLRIAINAAEEGLTRSLLTVKEAKINAQVMRANASAQAGAIMAGATAQANAYRRQGDIALQVGNANAQAAYLNGQANAINTLGSLAGTAGKLYTDWKASQTNSQMPNRGA